MSALTLAISRALIHFVWQASIVGFSLWGVLLILRKRPAGVRYAAGCTALALMAIMPIGTTWMLYSGLASSAGTAVPARVVQSISAHPDALRNMQHPWLTWLQIWALPVWSLGVLLFSMRFVWGYKHAFALRRRGAPAGESVISVVARLARIMGVRHPVGVLMSSVSDSPGVVGWLRPVILLPAATLLGLTPLQLEAILAHEMGHIKRYDYLVNMLQMLVETLLFYHPAVWWTSKRIRIERELCCDDLAVRFSGNALRYARALTTLEKLRLRTPTVVMASTGGSLLYRVQRLAGVTAKDYGPSRLPAVVAIALGILCLGFNVTWIRGQDAPGVQVDLGSSSVIHRTAVPYPETAKTQGITGTVQMEVKLDATGNVADARVLSGPEELRKAALESVLKWHFTSDAARTTRLITIVFSEQGTHVQVREPQGPRAIVNEDERKLADQKMKLAEIEAAYSRAARASQDGDVQLARRQELEREIIAMKQKVQEAGGASIEETAAMQYKLALLQGQFAATQQPGRGGRGNLLSVRVLKRISTPGLIDSVRNDLISRLPLREGDTLSPKLLEQAAAAVRSYDEHLRVQSIATDDGQTELRISPPNERP